MMVVVCRVRGGDDEDYSTYMDNDDVLQEDSDDVDNLKGDRGTVVMMAAMMMLMTTAMMRIDWFPGQDGIIAGCQDEELKNG